MAIVSIDIPDNQINRVLNAFATYYNYNPASGLTKAQFAKQQLALHVKSVVQNVETNAAINTARATVQEDVGRISIS